MFVGPIIAIVFGVVIVLILLISAAAAAAVFIIPFGRRARTGDDKPKVRIDERDTMFSRNALREESVQFENYYLRNPEKREPDDRFRMRPGLLSKNAKHYEPIPFSAAHASFKTVEALAATLKAESLGEPPVEVGPVEISSFIKRWCRELGAVSVGVTELADYHFYSVIGRGERYGQAVDPEHKFAIALTVEMEKSMIDSAPHGPTVMESAQRRHLKKGVGHQGQGVAGAFRRLRKELPEFVEPPHHVGALMTPVSTATGSRGP